MALEAESPKPRGKLLRILSWVGLFILAACLLLGLGLDVAGLRVGSEASYLKNLNYEGVPVPTVDPQTKTDLPGTTITIWFLHGPRFFSAETIFAEELSRGTVDDGKLAYYIAFDEAGFNSYMLYWFMPSNEDLKEIYEDIQNPHIDLTTGGLVLYVDLKVGSEWKPAGLIYELDESGTQLNFRGISMDGSVVTNLPGSLLDDKVGGIIERLSNRALRELTFIDEQTGKHLTIKQIYIEDDRAEVLAVESNGEAVTEEP